MTRTLALPHIPAVQVALTSLAALLMLALPLKAQDMVVSHGYSFFGDLKYPADYPHFSYVNPDAPKGGEVSLATGGTFDSMNPYSRKGRAGALSSIMYESLMGQVLAGRAAMPADDLNGMYCLLCERVEYPVTKEWVVFHMRPEARFSDGTPLTAHDVLFSHNKLLDEGLKSYGDAVRKRIPKAEVLSDYSIKFYFTEGISRRSLIDQVGGVPVWSKKWYEEKGYGLDEGRLDVSPGSSPYMIDTVDVNRRIVYKRNPDYWGKDLPINIGRHNFDRIRVEYFTDQTAAFEALKAGEVTFRTESDPKIWASEYDFPAVVNGSVKREELRDGIPPAMEGLVFNLGRETLKDKRVRQAITLAFNFEWTNKSLLYGLFAQQTSFSDGTPLMSTALPEGDELAFLKSLGDVVPEDMLTSEVYLPHTSDADRLNSRRNIRGAMKLLDEAGWPVGSDGLRRNADGDLLTIDFLLNASGLPTNKAIMENFASNLKTLGIDVKIESVDAAQYTNRERDRDYDLVFDGYPALLGTGTGLRQRLGSESAEFSLFNPAGLASPMVDAIIDASLQSTSQEEEDLMIRALDRALRYEFFVIPTGYTPNHWVAYFDMYEHPENMPPYALGTLDFWWYNADKASALKASGVLR